MRFLRAAFLSPLLILNVVLWGTPVFLGGLLKLITRGEVRRRITLIAAWHGEQWVRFNDGLFDAFLPTVWDISVPDGLRHDGHYLIFSNHRSWVDILAVFRAFHGRTPFIRFFLKHELIWSPIVGQACWALDFPFMKRYSPEYLARHPEKRGKDLETTRRACRRYRRIPVSILNFMEGTRFSEDKREEQQSPYRHLLRPRVGGIGFVLASLGEQLDAVLDVTIAYSDPDTTIIDFITGRVPRITVHAREVTVPDEFYSPSIVEPGPMREAFRAWIEGIWAEKDARLAQIQNR